MTLESLLDIITVKGRARHPHAEPAQRWWSFQTFSQQLQERLMDSCNRIVFSVKSFEIFPRISRYFSAIILLSICFTWWYLLDSIALHDIIVKKTYYLSMYIFIQLRGMNWWMENYCGFRLWLTALGVNLAPIRSLLRRPLDHPSGRDYHTDDAQLISIRWWREMYATTTAS